jgi:hypothetical protein
MECEWNPYNNTEDEIGKTLSYRNNPIYTVFFKKDGKDVIFKKDNAWSVPRESHFIIDLIRYYRRVGWNK